MKQEIRNRRQPNRNRHGEKAASIIVRINAQRREQMETYRSGHDSGRDQCAQCLQPAQGWNKAYEQ